MGGNTVPCCHPLETGIALSLRTLTRIGFKKSSPEGWSLSSCKWAKYHHPAEFLAFFDFNKMPSILKATQSI